MAEFDEYKDTYSEQIDQATRFSRQGHSFFVRAKARCLAGILQDKLPGPHELRVLDIGCGHGLIHPMLAASGLPLRITGVDVAAQVIDLARQANPEVDYEMYDGKTLPYESAVFDAAFTITVMHHVPPLQWPRFLAEMKRVVRPGGIVTVFEHNPLNPLTTYIVRTCPIDKNAVLLSSRRLSKLMEGAGLSELETRFILFTPFESGFFRGFDRALSWLPLGAQYHLTGRVPRDSAELPRDHA